MNSDNVNPSPRVTVYRTLTDFVLKEVKAPLLEAGENPDNYDTTAFARDFSSRVNLPVLFGYFRTFDPALIVSLIQNYATTTKLRDLKVGDEFSFNHFDHILIAKSNVFKDHTGEDGIVVVLLEDGNNCPATYTLSADSRVKTH